MENLIGIDLKMESVESLSNLNFEWIFSILIWITVAVIQLHLLEKEIGVKVISPERKQQVLPQLTQPDKV